MLRAAETPQAVADALGITSWDILIIGDGSAQTWKYAGGWAACILDGRDDSSQLVYGGANALTNILAEMMSFGWALLKLVNDPDALGRGPVRVHCVTDCEYVAMAGSRRWPRRQHPETWNWIDSFQRWGILLNWHWIPRDTVHANQLSHLLANLARESMKPLEAAAVQKLRDKAHGQTKKRRSA